MSSDTRPAMLKGFARRQRANAVQAEAILWRALRDRRCDNAKVRRRAAIGRFIVDFGCCEKRLVVEADGPSHAAAARQTRDWERDAWLREQGFRILRLPNELVIGAPAIAVRIRAALAG